jgi:hypothetical protein
MDLDGCHCLGGNGNAAIDTGRIAEIGPPSRAPGPAGYSAPGFMREQIGDPRLSP